MLFLTVLFLILAIIAAVLGFGAIAFVAAGIVKALFVIFLILFIVFLILHLTRPAR